VKTGRFFIVILLKISEKSFYVIISAMLIAVVGTVFFLIMEPRQAYEFMVIFLLVIIYLDVVQKPNIKT